MSELTKTLKLEQRKEDDLEKAIKEMKRRSMKRAGPLVQDSQPVSKRQRREGSYNNPRWPVDDLSSAPTNQAEDNDDSRYDELVDIALDTAISLCNTSTVTELNMPSGEHALVTDIPTEPIIDAVSPTGRAEHWAGKDLTGSRGDSLRVRLCPTKTGPVVRYVGIHATNIKEPSLPYYTPGIADSKDQAGQPEMGLDQAEHCGNKDDRADQHQGPGNGPGMTEKAATVHKLTVRERVSRQTDPVIELKMPEMNQAEHWADQELTGSRGNSLKDRLCPTKTGPVVRYVGIHATNNKGG